MLPVSAFSTTILALRSIRERWHVVDSSLGNTHGVSRGDPHPVQASCRISSSPTVTVAIPVLVVDAVLACLPRHRRDLSGHAHPRFRWSFRPVHSSYLCRSRSPAGTCCRRQPPSRGRQDACLPGHISCRRSTRDWSVSPGPGVRPQPLPGYDRDAVVGIANFSRYGLTPIRGWAVERVAAPASFTLSTKIVRSLVSSKPELSVATRVTL